MIPGVASPTVRDLLGIELADRQLQLVADLREIRLRHGLSTSEVAAAMGCDPAEVSMFESGSTNPTMAIIRRYAKAVRASVRFLVEDVDQ